MAHDIHTETPCCAGRNHWIDLLRFIFILVIVFFHQNERCCELFCRGNFAVYFFFLLSGYLAAKSIKRQSATNPSYLSGCASFMKRKMLAVHPEVVLSTLTFLVVLLLTNTPSLHASFSLPIKAFFSDIMFLRMTGIECSVGVGYGWYISSMLIGLLILYPVIRKWGGNVFLFMGALLIFGYIKISTGSLMPHMTSALGGTYAGNYMALAGLMLGASLTAVKFKNPPSGRNVAVIALLTLAVSLCCLNTPISVSDKPHTMDTLCLFGMCVLLLCAVNSQAAQKAECSLGRKWESLCVFLGKLSLPLYLIHLSCHTACRAIFPALQGPVYILLYIGLSLAAAYGVMLASSWLRKKIARFYE